MRIGIAADQVGFELKENLIPQLKAAGFEVLAFGSFALAVGDDYPDYVVPLAKPVATGELKKGLASCGSAVGAGVAANKVPGVRG